MGEMDIFIQKSFYFLLFKAKMNKSIANIKQC